MSQNRLLLLTFLTCASLWASPSCAIAQVGLRWPDPKPDFIQPIFPTLSFQSVAGDIPPLRVAILRPTYCYEDLAFFCRLEVKMEQTLRFPVKFRLGDVAYVDWLEGKRKF